MKVVLALLLCVLVSGCTTSGIYSVDYIVENNEKLLNKEITVTGEAIVYRLKCTQIFCDEDDPCCNSCGGELALKGDTPILVKKSDGDAIVCRGDNCAQQCDQLEIGSMYEVTGMLRYSDEYYIEMGDFKKI